MRDAGVRGMGPRLSGEKASLTENVLPKDANCGQIPAVLVPSPG